MNKSMRAEISLNHTMGDLLYYNRTIVSCVQLARDERYLIKKIRDYLLELPEDVKSQYDLRYIRGHKSNPDKIIPYKFKMRKKLNELVYEQFKPNINKYIEDSRAVLRINLNMDVYTMFVKCQKHRDNILKVSTKLLKCSERKLVKLRGHVDK